MTHTLSREEVEEAIKDKFRKEGIPVPEDSVVYFLRDEGLGGAEISVVVDKAVLAISEMT
jgi:hypothetical protein